MHRRFVRSLWLIALGAVLLTGADNSWKTKPSAQWTEEDARQVLTASPWARDIVAGVARRLGEDELRVSGQMGQPTGVGYDGVDPKGSGPKLPGDLISGRQSARSQVGKIALRLRWESALPVRVAEFKARVSEPPTLEGGGYRIAVYGLPGGPFDGNPKELGDPLRKEAVLKRAGKRDVKPLRVEVFQLEDGVAVVYLFPLSAELTKKDREVIFDAHIGRIVVFESFDLGEMEFQGKLEL